MKLLEAFRVQGSPAISARWQRRARACRIAVGSDDTPFWIQSKGSAAASTPPVSFGGLPLFAKRIRAYRELFEKIATKGDPGKDHASAPS
jgi:hypothetical protein